MSKPNVQNILTHDCHVHFALDGLDWKKALNRHKGSPDVDLIRQMLRSYAEAGTSFIREGGDRFEAGWIARNLAPEYEIEFCSPIFPIYQKGNYGSFIGRAFESRKDFESLVDEVASRGGDYVKVMLSGIMDFNNYGVITGHSFEIDEIKEMVKTVHSRGLALMAHTNGAQAIKDAVLAGVDSIEHGYYMDESAKEALVASKSIWVPTLSPICNTIESGRYNKNVLVHITNDQKNAIKEVADNGGIIAMGSDAGAGSVEHVLAIENETSYMKEALGEKFESVILRGLEEIKARFGRRR